MDLPVQQFRTEAEQGLLDVYEAARKALPGARDKFVSDLRDQAIAAYGDLGLPHRRIEAWKYTDLRARLNKAAPLIKVQGIGFADGEFERALGSEIARLPAYRLAVVEGDLRVELSDVAALKAAGVEAISMGQAFENPPAWLQAMLAQAPRQGDAVLALNTALMSGGVALRIGEGVILDKPIHVVQLDGKGTAASIVTRNVIVAGRDSAATVLESFGSLGMQGLQRNAVTEISVAEKAALKHIKLQREDSEAFHLSTWLASLAADSRYDAFQFSVGGALARNQIYAKFTGENARAEISGVFLLRDRQHCDTTILVEHLVPHCATRELLKAVLDDEARGIFQGKIVVAPGAQKTDSKQMAQALLLAGGAEFDSKPELEIFADDVVCGHGSTSGQIDEDLLFYLEARGIPEAEARALLITAFVGEALDQIEDEPLREALSRTAAGWLGVRFD